MMQLQIGLIDKSVIATREEQRKLVKNADGLVKVPFDKIVVREGFNVRKDFYEIDELANSILNIGLKDPLDVDILKDGTAVLIDGERRYRAITIIREMYGPGSFDFIMCKTGDKEATELDRFCKMMATQSSKAFHPLDESEAFQKMRDGYMGHESLSITQIAERVGRSIPYVEQRLLLATATSEEKKLIREGKTKSTVVTELIRKEDSAEVRIDKIKEANSRGKRLKVKDVKESPATPLCDDIIAATRKINTHRDSLPVEVQDMIIEINSKIILIKKILK